MTIRKEKMKKHKRVGSFRLPPGRKPAQEVMRPPSFIHGGGGPYSSDPHIAVQASKPPSSPASSSWVSFRTPGPDFPTCGSGRRVMRSLLEVRFAPRRFPRRLRACRRPPGVASGTYVQSSPARANEPWKPGMCLRLSCAHPMPFPEIVRRATWLKQHSHHGSIIPLVPLASWPSLQLAWRYCPS